MKCYLCKAALDPADRFCAGCGLPLPAAPPSDARKREAVLRGDVDVQALTRLRSEKDQLAGELHQILQSTGDRELSAHERRICSELYGKWQRVSAEVTARVEYFCQRMDRDRRSRSERTTERRRQQVAISIEERRTATDRREADRRGPDRRDPFKDAVPDA